MAEDFVPLYQRIVTGQLRRRPTEDFIHQLVEQIDERGSGVVSVACLDIDGFSKLEEGYGYTLADIALDAVAAYLEDFAAAAFSARYVRDSFLIVYEGLTLEQAFLEIEQLRSKLTQKTFIISDGSREASMDFAFSAGVATYPGDPEDHLELISLAEAAAARAYEEGGHRTILGRAVNMTPKTSHYSPAQLERLRELRERLGRSEASLLREALDDMLRKYDQRDSRRSLEEEEHG